LWLNVRCADEDDRRGDRKNDADEEERSKRG
jgi:hypothetical protein